MKEKIKYITAFSNCKKRKCFIPFTGNGSPICRLYEVGQCKGKESPLTNTKKLKGINDEAKN
jgi:hypothetical protein